MKNLKKLVLLSLASLAITACKGGETPSTPSADPSVAPSVQPSVEPSVNPSVAPSVNPSVNPSEEPSEEPSIAPSVNPSEEPSVEPSQEPGEEYERELDDDVYDRALATYEELILDAKEEMEDDDLRFVKYAKAEAALLDAAVFIPTTTRGGAYAVTRVAPRTIPYANWGNDTDRLKGLVLAEAASGEHIFISGAQRAEMIELWDAARAGGADYDPAAYLEAHGFTVAHSYRTSFSTAPTTIDIQRTSKQSDTESLINAIEGLLEYDNLGNLNPRIATNYEISDDGLEYVFHLRDDAKWYGFDGAEYANVKADDFVAGIQHMLDTKAGLEYLIEDVIVGVTEYLYKGGAFANVGVEAIDDTTLKFTLVKPEPFFPTRLEYSCFMPMNRQFFIEQGGAFGINEFKEAAAKDEYAYGIYGRPETALYNSAFIPQALSAESMTYVKNPNYYDADKVTLDQIQWVKDNGEDGEAIWNKAKDGTYAGTGLSEGLGTLKKAKDEGLFDTYHYVTDTNSTTFFNGYNLNRGTFEVGTVVSGQSEAQKIATHRAMQNANFRRALQHAWNRVNHNAVSVGEDLAPLCVRNMYTQPTFLALSKNVEFDNQVFAQGTYYGDLVEWFLINTFGREVETRDGQDGWYNPELAQHYLELAKEELGDDWEKVVIDMVYYAPNATQTGQANYYKLCIEEALGSENVEINAIGTSNVDDFYLCGYDSASGLDACYDTFYGSGWGPDYGDPSTYLDTFNYGGYMLKVIGLDC